MSYELVKSLEGMLRVLHHDPERALSAAQALLLLCALEEPRFAGAPSGPGPLAQALEVEDQQLLGVLQARLRRLNGRGEQLDEVLGQLHLEGLSAPAVRQALGYAQRAARSEGTPARFSQDLFGALLEASGQLRPGLGQFFTPSPVAQAMATILEPAPGEWVLEPSCGSGVLLLSAVQALRERHGPQVARSLTLVGIELDARGARLRAELRRA